MGGERTGKGKRLFLCLACVITILPVVAGCISFLNKSEGDASLATAKSLFSQEKYATALRESEEILIRYPETHGDEALLLMGLIWAHPLNPDVNYKKSLQYFDRLIKEFPLSPLTDEAGIWIHTTRKLQDSEREIQALKKQGKRNREALIVRQKQIKMLQEQISRIRTHLTDLQEEKKTLDFQIKNLNDQMKRLKEIDLKIEEQKRGTFDQ